MAFDYEMLGRTELPQGETRFRPYPVTDGVLAQITEAKFTGGVSDKGPWTRYDVTLEVSDPSYLAQVPSDNPIKMRYGIMVDMQNGRIAMGPNKNVRLNRYRAAAGVNKEGKTLDDAIGNWVKVSVIQKPHPNGDTNDDGSPVILSEVSGVTAAQM